MNGRLQLPGFALTISVSTDRIGIGRPNVPQTPAAPEARLATR